MDHSTSGKHVLLLFKIEGLAPIREPDLGTMKELVTEYDRLKTGAIKQRIISSGEEGHENLNAY